MPNITEFTQYSNEVNFLKSAHFVSFTAIAESDLVSGAIYPANDATAKGIVFHDTKAGQPVAIIVEGHVYADRLPAAATTEAQTALKQISFHAE